MTDYYDPTATVPNRTGWLTKAENWLDERGKGAWIAAMVIGLVFFWPIGLALLAYMIWSKRMFSGKTCRKSRSYNIHATKSSGNSAFDAYRNETLRRLEQEQSDFEAFLKRLRDAKDKAEFDEFMDERAKAAREPKTDVEHSA